MKPHQGHRSSGSKTGGRPSRRGEDHAANSAAHFQIGVGGVDGGIHIYFCDVPVDDGKRYGITVLSFSRTYQPVPYSLSMARQFSVRLRLRLIELSAGRGVFLWKGRSSAGCE